MKHLRPIFRFVKYYLLFSVGSCLLVSCAINNDKTAGTFAPQPAQYSDAVVQVYAARTWGAKKIVSVHTWISIKEAYASEYTSYEIIGWRLKRRGSAFVERQGNPDRDWWGNQPEIILDVRGKDAQKLIPQIRTAAESYPYKDEYQAWPGPNSNTFTAYIGREVPELGLDLPSTAIGKDYRDIDQTFGMSASGSGVQASLWGVLGLTLGVEEGLELNILGLNIELDLLDLAVELPGVGRIGASDVEAYDKPQSQSAQQIASKNQSTKNSSEN